MHRLGLSQITSIHFFPIGIWSFSRSNESFEAQLESITDFQAFHKLEKNLLTLLKSHNQHNDDERAAIALLDYILELCIKHRASDIHFELKFYTLC